MPFSGVGLEEVDRAVERLEVIDCCFTANVVFKDTVGAISGLA